MGSVTAWLKGAAGLVVLGLLVFAGIAGYQKYRVWAGSNESEWKKKYEAQVDSTRAWKDSAARDSIEYVDRVKPVYVGVRDRALGDPKTPESTRAAYKACDLVVSACEKEKATLRRQIGSLEAQVDQLEHRPKERRFTAEGSALYDALGKRPVFRLGGRARIFGGFSAVVEGEYAVPSALTDARGEGRVLIGGTIKF